jgi:OFA family oxalate/formate antiporter-like MFS transporter
MSDNQPAAGPSADSPEKTPDRRIVLACGMILLACLGSVYAWSFFTKPLCETYGWSKMQVSAVFSLAVAGLGLSAAYTGPLVSKLGARRLMVRSAMFFCTGYLVAALGLWLGSGVIGPVTEPFVKWTSLVVLGLGYGVIGGIGLGTGYVTGVTTIAGWFPDKKGFATGLVVMGFGLGAFVMSKLFAPLALQAAGNNLPLAFLIIGVAFCILMPLTCRGIESAPAATSTGRAATVAESIEHGPGVQIKLCLVCFLYSIAGLGTISLLSPLMQKISGSADPSLTKVRLAEIGATLIACASLGNSGGRLFWAWISDKIGRVNAFIALLASAGVVFLALPHVSSPLIFGALLTFTVASYGGGFGTIPSLISDLYGPKRMSAVHGKVLMGWAMAGLTAPPLFGYLNDTMPDKAAAYAFHICAAALFLSCSLVATFKALHLKTTAIPALAHAADDPD